MSVVLLGVWSQPSSGASKAFPQPPNIAKQVVFWKRIFLRFPSTTTLVHDSRNPSAVVDIIDHKLIARYQGRKSPGSFKQRNRLSQKYLERYELAIKRFAKYRKRALRFGPIEKRLYSVYKRKPAELARLMRGKVKLRVQSGLADVFVRAADRAQDYLPFIEKEFRARGVPVRISRLAFVESMFNVKARSKVGASGIWQFMPSTARSYMIVNRFIDERNSPLKASRGAARLLADNYRGLRSWPLAITAYNHGRGGMMRAVRKLGTKDIGRIVRHYRSRTFGFASRNFYAEYLAADYTFAKLISSRKVRRRGTRLNLASIKLPKSTSVASLTRSTALTKSVLKRYNRDISKLGLASRSRRTLPKGFEIFVPAPLSKSVLASLGGGRKKGIAKARRRNTREYALKSSGGSLR